MSYIKILFFDPNQCVVESGTKKNVGLIWSEGQAGNRLWSTKFMCSQNPNQDIVAKIQMTLEMRDKNLGMLLEALIYGIDEMLGPDESTVIYVPRQLRRSILGALTSAGYRNKVETSDAYLGVLPTQHLGVFAPNVRAMRSC